MLTQIINKLKNINLLHFIWISVVFSEVLTAIMSIILRGRITQDYLITGGVVSLIVASIVIYLIKELRETEKRLTDAVRESEKRFRELAEQSPNMIFINKRGRIVYANERCVEIMGYTREEFYSEDFDFMKLIAPESQNQVKKNFRKHMTGEEIPPYEYKVLTKDGREIIAIHTTKLIDFDGERAILGILTDITEHKKIEEGMKRRLMKFRLEGGNLYLVKEHALMLSIEVFNDILKIGYPGIVISRSSKETFEKIVKGVFDFLWLADKQGEGILPPDLKKIGSLIEDLPDKSAVLIERMDYLIYKNGFEKTLGFVQQIRETAYFKQHVVILSIDPSDLTRKRIRLLEKETSTIQTQQMLNISDDLLEILRFIYMQNQLGVKPSYTEICLGVRISKPTCRKKINQLKNLGFVMPLKSGRKKVVEVTDKSRDIFLK